MQVQRQSNGSLLRLGPQIAGGGEGKIYSVNQHPGWVAKLYHQPSPDLGRKLAVMAANPPDDPTAASGHVSIAWVLDPLWQRGRIIGFLMPRVNEGFPLHDVYTPRSRRDRCPFFNYQYLYRSARNLAAAVSRIHSRGYVIGDVNESNILVSRTALITLVDTDSFQVSDGDTLYPCPVGKPEFTPPELQGKTLRHVRRRPEQDCFGLAVLIFQLLMEGTHPFAGVYLGSGDPPPIEARIAAGHFAYSSQRVPYRPTPIAPAANLLTPQLQQLFTQCFEQGHRQPQQRPNAQTWVKALEQAEAQLMTCSVNPQHRYGSHLSQCPWCDRSRKLGGRDPFPRSSQEVGRLQRYHPPKPKAKAKPRPGRPRVPQAVGYTIAFPSPHSLSKITPPMGILAQLKADIGQYFWEYRYDFLGGSLVIALALSAGIYLSDTSGDRPSQVSESSSPTSLSQTSRAGTDPPRNATRTDSSFPHEATPLTLSQNAVVGDEKPLDRRLSLTLADRRYDHRDRVTALAVSPNGDWFASSSSDGTLKIWSFPDRVLLQSRRLSSVLGLPEDQVQLLAVSPDGDRLIGATAQGLQTWNPDSFDLINTLPLPIIPKALSLSDRQGLQIGGTSGGDVAIWDLQGLREHRRWTANQQQVLALSPKGETLVTASPDAITLWDVETGQPRATLPQTPPEQVVAALSPDGQLLAMTVPADHGMIQIWDTRTGTLLHSETASHISSLVFGMQGQTLIGGDIYGSIGIWHINAQPQISAPPHDDSPET
ncbi:MAG: putative DNA-binding protein kinase [Phormidium sp. OSCR]|nr:MAG: putative DNA-binding protein kinase [Phormidium sp. OSCR]